MAIWQDGVRWVLPVQVYENHIIGCQVQAQLGMVKDASDVDQTEGHYDQRGTGKYEDTIQNNGLTEYYQLHQAIPQHRGYREGHH